MFFVFLAAIGLFTPPASWQACKPNNTSDYVHVGFVGKGSGLYAPSLTLATEPVDCSLQEYVKAVKAIHLEEPNNKWHDLGAIQAKIGRGKLIQITSPSPHGETVVLQALFVKDRMAYVVTAGVLKEDLVQCKNEILAAFRSFDVQPDLWSSVEDVSLRSKLASAFDSLSKETWSEFQELVKTATPQCGNYWQYLVLQSAQPKVTP